MRLIKTNIQGRFEFNDARKEEVEELKKQLENERLERERILGDSSIAEEKLIDVLKNYNSWQQDLMNCNRDKGGFSMKLKNIESELKARKEEKDKIDISSAKSFLLKTRDILRDIETIFIETKQKKFNEFIKKLQTKSNTFFKTINVDAFTGTIVFKRRSNGNRTIVEVKLQEEGRPFYKPNQSLLTSMHISILFAISELAFETKAENFPMIFDAPTSSFGENKTAQVFKSYIRNRKSENFAHKGFPTHR